MICGDGVAGRMARSVLIVAPEISPKHCPVGTGKLYGLGDRFAFGGRGRRGANATDEVGAVSIGRMFPVEDGDRPLAISIRPLSFRSARRTDMKWLAIAGALVIGTAFLPAGQAQAGCLTGALVGGAAGHFLGHHGFLGAAAGCFVGHRHEKKKEARTNHATPRYGSSTAPRYTPTNR
jgi:hypothetical protein